MPALQIPAAEYAWLHVWLHYMIFIHSMFLGTPSNGSTAGLISSHANMQAVFAGTPISAANYCLSNGVCDAAQCALPAP